MISIFFYTVLFPEQPLPVHDEIINAAFGAFLDGGGGELD
jgi:hypothetical protein